MASSGVLSRTAEVSDKSLPRMAEDQDDTARSDGVTKDAAPEEATKVKKASLLTRGKDRWKRWISSITIFDVAVATIACVLYMPDQVTSVGSKHLLVSLGVPTNNTGVYITKLYASKTLSNFTGSVVMFVIQILLPSYTACLSLIAAFFMLGLRIAVVVTFFSPDAAVHYYFAIITQAFCQGMFQTTFYPLAAEKMSMLSMSFKLSKIILWTTQVLMDIVITEKATWMISVHLVIVLSASSVGCILWMICCMQRITTAVKPEVGAESSPTQPTTTTEGQQTSVEMCPSTNQLQKQPSLTASLDAKPNVSRLKGFLYTMFGQRRYSAYNEKRCLNGCCDLSKDVNEKKDFSMWTILKRVYSPLLMCAIGWPFRTFFQPGILPYTLVDRKLCQPIIITLMFLSFVVSLIVHCVNRKSKTMKKPWGPPPWGWHLLWLFMVPPLLCLPFVYTALHYPQSTIYKGLHNNPANVGIISVIVMACTTVLDNSGYIGVAACSRVEGEPHGNNAVRFIAINALLAQFLASFLYRLSTGYIIIRGKYVDDISNTAPTEALSWFGRLLFWMGNTLVYAWNDFIQEFNGNIREYAS